VRGDLRPPEAAYQRDKTHSIVAAVDCREVRCDYATTLDMVSCANPVHLFERKSAWFRHFLVKGKILASHRMHIGRSRMSCCRYRRHGRLPGELAVQNLSIPQKMRKPFVAEGLRVARERGCA